jgi:hypothetical protein
MERLIKIMLLAIIVVGITVIGCITYLKINSPLVAAATGSSSEKRILLVEVGNKSRLAKIQIEEVLINNNNKPTKVKIQVSNPLKGFFISNNFEGKEESKYDFRDLKTVALQTETDPQKQLNKVNNGAATEKDKIYAITINHVDKIQKVIILGFHMKRLFRLNH